MARPSTISREEVFAAVASLIAVGSYPNPTNVRAELGGRGSPPLVQRYIGLWYAEFGPELARKAAKKPLEAPKTPTEGIQEQIKRLTASALEAVEQAEATRIAAIRDREAVLDARDENLRAREDKQDARELAHNELLGDLRKQLEVATEHMALLEAARTQEVEEIAACRTQLEAALAAKDVELERLRGVAEQVPVLKANVDRATAEATREQARVVELVNERDQLQRQCSDRRAELAKVQALLDSAVAAAGEQEARFIGQREQLQEALAQVAVAKSRGEALALELDQAAGRRLADSERIESLRAEISAGERDRAGLTVRLDVALQDVERLGVLGAGITSLKEEIGRLGMKIGQSQKESEKPLSTD